MEIEPEILPPVERPPRGQGGQRQYTFHYEVKQVHPLVGLLLLVAGIGLFAVLFVFFFWVALILLGISLVALVVRSVITMLRP